MAKRQRARNGKRALSFLLWAYAMSIVGFYAVVFRRSLPEKTDEDRLRAQPVDPSAPAPRVSIILPARDEERNIQGCVESLLAQTYPNFEVIVVDDASTDHTSTLLEQLCQSHPLRDHLRVIRVDHLPEGWAGKPHALHTGVSQATGEWLLVTDADTRHQPEALSTAMRTASERQLDLLSLGTTQDMPDFWSRVLIPMAYMGISMQYPAKQVNDPKSRIALANGQYILLRKALYERIGGYAAPHMRATVLDDRDLASEVKRAHGKLALVDGRGLVRTRMYHGLREQWDGWSKNAYAGSRGGLFFFLLMIIGLPMTCMLPFALLLLGLLARRPRWLAAGGLPVAATLAYRTRLNREIGVPWRYVWTHPLGAAIFTGILARSFWRKWSKRGVTWRGRTYQV